MAQPKADVIRVDDLDNHYTGANVEAILDEIAGKSFFGISSTNISNWNTAYGWGNHASAGYLTAETDPLSLHLDQSTPQTLTASPIFNWGTVGRIPFYSATKTLTDNAALGYDTTNNGLFFYGGVENKTAYIYAGNKPDGTQSVLYITATGANRRIYIGSETQGVYSVNFSYCTLFESFPYATTLNSGNLWATGITGSAFRGSNNNPFSLEAWGNGNGSGASSYLTGGVLATSGHRDIFWRSYYDPTDTNPAYASAYTYDTISNATALGVADHTTWRVAATTVIAKLSPAGLLTVNNLIDSGLTSGRIPFAGTAGLLSDSSNLVWDNTNKRISIGGLSTTTYPAPLVLAKADQINYRNVGCGQIQIATADTAPGYFCEDSGGNGGHGFVFGIYKGVVYIYRHNSTGNFVAGDLRMEMDNTETNFNESASDYDFRIESVNNANMFNLDATLNALGVGMAPTTSTAALHLIAGVNTKAPLRFFSGVSLTSPVAGTVEFTTDDLYLTITTGAARKKFVLDNGTDLVSGRIPFATTNGRLTDSAGLNYNVTTGQFLVNCTSSTWDPNSPFILTCKNNYGFTLYDDSGSEKAMITYTMATDGTWGGGPNYATIQTFYNTGIGPGGRPPITIDCGSVFWLINDTVAMYVNPSRNILIGGQQTDNGSSARLQVNGQVAIGDASPWLGDQACTLRMAGSLAGLSAYSTNGQWQNRMSLSTMVDLWNTDDANRVRFSMCNYSTTHNSFTLFWYGNNGGLYGGSPEAKWEMGSDFAMSLEQSFYLYSSKNSKIAWLYDSSDRFCLCALSEQRAEALILYRDSTPYYMGMGNRPSATGITSFVATSSDKFFWGIGAPSIGYQNLMQLEYNGDTQLYMFAGSVQLQIVADDTTDTAVFGTSSNHDTSFRANNTEIGRFKTNGTFSVPNMPTSSAGLSAGDLWCDTTDSNRVKMV